MILYVIDKALDECLELMESIDNNFLIIKER